MHLSALISDATPCTNYRSEIAKDIMKMISLHLILHTKFCITKITVKLHQTAPVESCHCPQASEVNSYVQYKLFERQNPYPSKQKDFSLF